MNGYSYIIIGCFGIAVVALMFGDSIICAGSILGAGLFGVADAVSKRGN